MSTRLEKQCLAAKRIVLDMDNIMKDIKKLEKAFALIKQIDTNEIRS